MILYLRINKYIRKKKEDGVDLKVLKIKKISIEDICPILNTMIFEQ
jgi:hypothetical protein